ncbi:proton-conducting transporter membrane subunit [Sinomonas sp. ASV322]|uniref:proton-conducting transporter transmembrane domain-containing protein n=1 Tax=Sinomonas sp. ASV322 TaxID=3041920 RepID=UPI0027DB57E7|nr:proton-conducting transporter membrane subunit [Sinomonas sp. ASV322]MDQ4504503.1 proton-conducting transporter membrane subunit [Sinomonas sp. ASV322]
MNLVAVGLAVATAAGVVTAVLAVVVPSRFHAAVSGIGTALVGAAGAAAGAAAVLGQPFALSLPWVLPLFGVSLEADPLGGLFVAVAGGAAATAGVYGIRPARRDSGVRATSVVMPLFAFSLLLVPVASGVGSFLALWELMALTSLVLVLTGRRRAEAVEAGRWYAVMTHLGLVAIMIGLMILVAHAGGDSFAALRAAAGSVPPAIAGTVFVLAVLGFGSKSGILPLHAWMSRAYSAAPGHAAVLMSAAMANLGVYGIVRVGFDFLDGARSDTARWWWIGALLLGAASAVYGILQAAMSSDLLRLLSFSSTENMGLILAGVGAAGLFASSGSGALAGLALVAALLHTLNHSAFKALLFQAAGSTVEATGSRDLDELGGLRPRMPGTTAAFGWGALAASALPPGTAFVSEWLLIQALIHGLGASGVASSVVLPVAVGAVALTAGLSVATFVKAFGVGFLARPRSDAASQATEAPATALVAMGLTGAACAILAVLPSLVLPGLGRVAGSLTGAAGTTVDGAVTLELSGVAGSLSPLVVGVGLLVAVVLAAGAVRALAVRRARRAARLWDCGAGPLTPRMEYTATSFAEPLQRVFDNVVAPETGVDVTHPEESNYLVELVEYRRTVPDRIERRLYRPVLALVSAWGSVGRRLASGSIHQYLAYGFFVLIGLLVALAVTR